jgi:predicted lipid-binding transport protein (Tim44 family)
MAITLYVGSTVESWRPGQKLKEGFIMNRLALLLGMVCLALFLVMACGKQEEPAKAEKSAAQQAAPAKKEAAPAAKPEAKPGASQPTAPPAAPTQPAPVKPSPEKK